MPHLERLFWFRQIHSWPHVDGAPSSWAYMTENGDDCFGVSSCQQRNGRESRKNDVRKRKRVVQRLSPRGGFRIHSRRNRGILPPHLSVFRELAQISTLIELFNVLQ
ncbi:hypothetical protein M413DRAFT_318850 [Hebeloma cylindrosporum]|uniref:Uncharacterized protein n=1 Tax=Hebeloma cylindrosporum TaxID=76867 RepID=A0A0C2Y597_HEBCY|nr:hypothetical protein M413DRAFT_318850 [Hebeloma cylindrosporum h7]